MSKRVKNTLVKDSVEIVVHDATQRRFKFTVDTLPQVLSILAMYQVSEDENEEDDVISADEVFKDLDKKYGKIGVTIRGMRHRDGLTQVELAQKIGIPQRHVSEMEHSKRPVGKQMAQKLAKIFKTSYRLFL